MTAALVGSVGTVVTGTSGGSITTLAFGTGESRTAGHLLICWMACDGATGVGVPSGWSLGISLSGTSCQAAVYYKIATGGDAAPTITGVTSGVISAMLAEFSGCGTGTPTDQHASNSGTSSPITAGPSSGADAASGELTVATSALFYSTAATKTITPALANATLTTTSDAGTSTANHSAFSYGFTTTNASADSGTLTYTTTKITGAAYAWISFLLAPPVAYLPPQIIHSAALGRASLW